MELNGLQGMSARPDRLAEDGVSSRGHWTLAPKRIRNTDETRGGSKRRKTGDGKKTKIVTKQGYTPRACLTIWTQKTGAPEEYRLKVETGKSKLKKKGGGGAFTQIHTTLPPTFPNWENLGPRDPVPLDLVWFGLVRQGLELEAVFLPLPSRHCNHRVVRTLA